MHGNKMGPENKGPKTGRGLGFCNGWGKSGYMSNEAPHGNRFGRGGFGRHGNPVIFENAKLLAKVEELEKIILELKK